MADKPLKDVITQADAIIRRLMEEKMIQILREAPAHLPCEEIVATIAEMWPDRHDRPFTEKDRKDFIALCELRKEVLLLDEHLAGTSESENTRQAETVATAPQADIGEEHTEPVSPETKREADDLSDHELRQLMNRLPPDLLRELLQK